MPKHFANNAPEVQLLLGIRRGAVATPTAEQLRTAAATLIDCALSGECQEEDAHKRELDDFARRIAALEEKQ